MVHCVQLVTNTNGAGAGPVAAGEILPGKALKLPRPYL